ncbi:radical SAM protein [uncultured Fusobacterium sp.]|uniref:radical SAM protein n=1 Tax=uncultured Fusobacterium sp. TaxID=159267 RepID=UPI0025CFDFD6|nr:radical SAM protein [uncultured Fusobacterium sp.]
MLVPDLTSYSNLYRPPSEAFSLILQITIGCSHNKCSFCSMYKGVQFHIKPFEQIKAEIDYFRSRAKYVNRIFLADGDALIVPTEKLIEILKYIKNIFPECERISTYASPKSLELKSEDELKKIKDNGISLLYIGAESGSDEVLKNINKGVTSKELGDLILKAKKVGFKTSVTFIVGILGEKDFREHAVATGNFISRCEPDYVGILSLMLEENTTIYQEWLKGNFKEADGIDILKEIKLIIENINVTSNIVFRSNHASNYINLKGNLPEDKKRLIQEIDISLNKHSLKEKKYRLL